MSGSPCRGFPSMETFAQLPRLQTLWASGTTFVAFQYPLIRILWVIRYPYHGIPVLIYFYIIAPGFAAAQLRNSFALVQASRQIIFAFLCHIVVCAQQVTGWNGAATSSPDQARAGFSVPLKVRWLCEGSQDGVGPASMQASAEGQPRSTGR